MFSEKSKALFSGIVIIGGLIVFTLYIGLESRILAYSYKNGMTGITSAEVHFFSGKNAGYYYKFTVNGKDYSGKLPSHDYCRYFDSVNMVYCKAFPRYNVEACEFIQGYKKCIPCSNSLRRELLKKEGLKTMAKVHVKYTDLTYSYTFNYNSCDYTSSLPAYLSSKDSLEIIFWPTNPNLHYLTTF